MNQRRGCKHAINRRQRIRHIEPAPGFSNLSRYWEESIGVGLAQCRQPGIEDSGLCWVAAAQAFNALPNLADNQHTDIQIGPRRTGNPGTHLRITRRFARLGEHIRDYAE